MFSCSFVFYGFCFCGRFGFGLLFACVISFKLRAGSSFSLFLCQRFRITARAGAYDFAWARGEADWTTLLADADGAMLSTRVAGGFVGAVFGVFAQTGP